MKKPRLMQHTFIEIAYYLSWIGNISSIVDSPIEDTQFAQNLNMMFTPNSQ